MQSQKRDPRLLAIDLRVQRFGYAVFEGPKRLLDWGAKSYPLGAAGAETAAKRVADLLELFCPSVVVIRKDHRTGLQDESGIALILRSIRHEAAMRAVPVRLIAPEGIKASFRIFNAKTKHEIAAMLATVFPELFWKLPPKRKVWQNEHFRMIVFDAISVGFAYWQRNGMVMLPPG
jgi:hypothetical protein